MGSACMTEGGGTPANCWGKKPSCSPILFHRFHFPPMNILSFRFETIVVEIKRAGIQSSIDLTSLSFRFSLENDQWPAFCLGKLHRQNQVPQVKNAFKV